MADFKYTAHSEQIAAIAKALCRCRKQSEDGWAACIAEAEEFAVMHNAALTSHSPITIATPEMVERVEAMREPTAEMVDAAAWQIAIRATQGIISPAKWETMPDDHRNEWECKNFWRTVATHAVKAAIDAALGEQH